MCYLFQARQGISIGTAEVSCIHAYVSSQFGGGERGNLPKPADGEARGGRHRSHDVICTK